MQRLPYYTYSSYLKSRYGKPAYRVGVDAGFSCPNREGDRIGEGCSYCESSGSRAIYLDSASPGHIASQIERGVAFLKRRYGAEVLLLYLQAFTNTYGTRDELRRVYDSCLSYAPFRELIVSTRPDEIDEPRADLLAEYIAEDFDVWVELGLQSVHDKTLRRIRRGHESAAFFTAYRTLTAKGIKVAVHLIHGLPGEGLEESLESVRQVAALRPAGIKLHNLHIPYNSPLYEEYRKGEVSVPSLAEHARFVAAALPLLPPETVIMRLTCDTPTERRAAPQEVVEKGRFAREVARIMGEAGQIQGSRFPV